MNLHSYKKALSFTLAAALALPSALPSVAWAAETKVELDNHTAQGMLSVVSDLHIGEVDKPEAGKRLDDKATVTSAEGKTWEVPVLWVSSSLKLAVQAEENESYLPAIAFFVPQEYRIENGSFTVTLSSKLTELFGAQQKDIISVYGAQTGITYILPASIRALFVSQRQPAAQGTDASPAPYAATEATEAPFVSQPQPAAQSTGASPAPSASTEAPFVSQGQPTAQRTDASPAPSASPDREVVDVYCAQTAIDNFSRDDLEYLLDLIINLLQPQAVELLMKSFPAFVAAADAGEIGRRIGLYVYYKAGDEDGIREHATADEALAYVIGDTITNSEGKLVFGYMVGVDLSSLARIDDTEEPVRDAQGKLILMCSGKPLETFENTVVHEMFHAFMDDYNRTGMAGGKNSADVATDDEGVFPTKELENLYNTYRFPTWFTEGSASAVENVYAFRKHLFSALGLANAAYDTKTYDQSDILRNYVQGAVDKFDQYNLFDLKYCRGADEQGIKVDNTASAYVCGYLATLHLSELAASREGASAIDEDADGLAVSSERLRMGLNSILERLHKGETLDAVINDLSPVDDLGNKLYSSTADYQDKFIKGVEQQTAEGPMYPGDNAQGGSLPFVHTLLNYLHALDSAPGRDSSVNGSILFDFARDYLSPLDESREVTSDFYRIEGDNRMIESTVPDSVACVGGGKSDPLAAATQAVSLAVQTDGEIAEEQDEELAEGLSVQLADEEAEVLSEASHEDDAEQQGGAEVLEFEPDAGRDLAAKVAE